MRYLRYALLGLVTVVAVLAGVLGPDSTRADLPPELDGPDFRLPPPEPPGAAPGFGAPTAIQTSQFMAGTVVYSVVFVESSGGAGNCADTSTENWSAGRRTTVLNEIRDGLDFWETRGSAPSPLSFQLDDRGIQATSCEPISRPSTDENLWVADVLTSMGFAATTGDYFSVARSFADSRRTAAGTDWGFVIFVVDSLVDTDGMFAPDINNNTAFAYAYLNGPFMVMTYDNDGWGIGQMNLVTAHETGHTFGALDEYMASDCSTSDSWGYLNVSNASCNNSGNTGDISVMGESAEQVNPAVDVSTSVRGAIGWRNPVGNVVDVVRTATVSLTPFTPDPTFDNTPTYSASGGNTAFPPEGPRMLDCSMLCANWGTATAVTVSTVSSAEWNLDGGAWTSAGLVPADGAFDEETDPYTFTPQTPLADGTYTFSTRSTNNFGHLSSLATPAPTDDLTINSGITATVTVGNTAPGAARATTTTLTVPQPGNLNWDTYITFDPADDVTQTCNSGTTHTGGGTCLATGDSVGAVALDMYLSISNNLCLPNILLAFDLYAVPTPDNPADPRASTNIAYTQPEGTSDRFSRWGTSPISVGGGTPVTYTGLQADATNIALQNYPEFLLDLYDADGPAAADPLVPLAVYGAISNLLGLQAVPIYIVTFNPGALAAEFTTPNPLGQATANLGYASQMVVNDPTQTLANPAPTVICSTSVVTTLNATVGGITRATNPDGVPCTTTGCTRLNLAWLASERDLDNDGIEDVLDSCPFDVNVDGDPRVAGSDPDGDFIDTICDPNPGSNDSDDIDGDGFTNLQDNCPQVSNPSQLESELLLGVAPGYTAGRANDGGPLGDDIGDACDAGVVAVTYNALPTVITLGSTVANGRWNARGLVTPICYGGTDNDGDGYCADDTDLGTDNDPARHASWTLTPVLSDVLGTTSGASAGSWDTDGGNGTGLGYDSDWIETYLGIDSRQPCSLSAIGGNDEPVGAYIFDYNTDQDIDFGDILPISPVFFAPVTSPLGIRFDWNVDGFVDFGDVLTIAPVFNQACVP